MKATGSRAAATVFSALARACRVPPPSATWKLISSPTYDNSIGELEFDERTANVTISRTASQDEDGLRLRAVHIHSLSGEPNSSPA